MLQALVEELFRVACAATGHGVLWAVTLGRGGRRGTRTLQTLTTDRDILANNAGLMAVDRGLEECVGRGSLLLG